MTRQDLWIATAAVALLATLANSQTSAPVSSSLPSDAEIRALLVDRIDVQHKTVGIVVGIITPQGRRIISYGKLDRDTPRPLDGDTIFEIGSVTKVFTALLLADMAKRGEVALTDPVAKYLPAGVKTPERGGRQITLVDLATQTSGLPFWPTNFPLPEETAAYSKYTVEQLYQFLSDYQLLRDIGVRWEYSNLGVGLLGLALSRRAGTDYEGLVRARITGPLGMESTAITISPRMKARLAVGYDAKLQPAPDWEAPVFAGAGSLRSSANNLLTFLGAFLGYTKSPLAPAMALMLETRRPGDEMLTYLGAEQALGWWVLGRGEDQVMAHGGDTLGFSSSVAYHSKTRVGVVVLANSANSADDIAMHLLRPSYPLSKPQVPKMRQEITVDPKLFDLYAGKYQAAPNVIFVIERRGDTLRFLGPLAPLVRLHAESERRYFIADSDVEITFQVDAHGRATGLILHLGELPIPAQRIESAAKKP